MSLHVINLPEPTHSVAPPQGKKRVEDRRREERSWVERGVVEKTRGSRCGMVGVVDAGQQQEQVWGVGGMGNVKVTEGKE